jgi:hypothetical protein
MSTTKSAPDNLTTALDALTAEVGQPVEREELVAYLTRIDEVMSVVKAIRDDHKAARAVIASQKSRAARADRVNRALALLEAHEAETQS